VLIEANAIVLDRFRAKGALRAGADSADICRLLMSVAAVADHGKLDPPAVRPRSQSSPTPCSGELLH